MFGETRSRVVVVLVSRVVEEEDAVPGQRRQAEAPAEQREPAER